MTVFLDNPLMSGRANRVAGGHEVPLFVLWALNTYTHLKRGGYFCVVIIGTIEKVPPSATLPHPEMFPTNYLPAFVETTGRGR
jgi:hypothetical protein